MVRRLLRPHTVANVLVWVASYLIMTGRVVLLQPLPHPWQLAGRRLVVTLLCFAACEAMWPLIRPLARRPMAQQLAAGFAASLLGATAYGLINRVVMYALAAPWPAPRDLGDVVFTASMQIWVVMAWCAIMLILARQPDRGDAARPEPDAQAYAREFWVRRGRQRISVPVEAIELIRAEGDYLRLHAGGQSYLLHHRLQALMRRLDPNRFLQVHRSAVVRRDRIASLRRLPGGQIVVVLVGGAEVRVSRRHRSEVLDLTRDAPDVGRPAPGLTPQRA